MHVGFPLLRKGVDCTLRNMGFRTRLRGVERGREGTSSEDGKRRGLEHECDLNRLFKQPYMCTIRRRIVHVCHPS